jgi:hypothetical protein
MDSILTLFSKHIKFFEMKKLIYTAIILVSLTALISSCKKSFDELRQNPNKPTDVPPSLLFNGILNSLYNGPDGSNEKWCQYYCENYDYYGNNRYDFGAGTNYYSTLNSVLKMEEEAAKAGANPELNPYAALGKFFKAYFFTKMSLSMGDIPMKDALLGAENLTPAYDTQKDVFKQSFLWLDSANNELATLITNANTTLAGDIYLGNNLSAWQKVVNTFRLRLLIHLGKKESDADLNIKQQFADIIGNAAKYPVMKNNSDNLQYTYINPTNKYPSNPSSFGFNATRKNTSATYVGLLTQLKDPRVFATTEPAEAKIKGGISPTSFDAFVGADPGEDLGAMYDKAGTGQYSFINRHRYYETFIGEPSVQIGYPELCFTIAEAINRGWVSGDAEAYYTAGIKASWASYNIPESGSYNAFFLKSGSPGSSAVYDNYAIAIDWNTYYAQTAIKYAGNNATGLTQILQQKYLSMFRHSGLEAYFTYRRTGVPVFTTGAGTGNSGRIALRFQYFGSEKTANTTNYQAALQSQYGGNDDINGVMWILK